MFIYSDKRKLRYYHYKNIVLLKVKLSFFQILISCYYIIFIRTHFEIFNGSNRKVY